MSLESAWARWVRLNPHFAPYSLSYRVGFMTGYTARDNETAWTHVPPRAEWPFGVPPRAEWPFGGFEGMSCHSEPGRLVWTLP